MKEESTMRNKTGIIMKIMSVLGILLLLLSCNSALDVQQSYEFDIEVMPLPKEIEKNETIEIRCTLINQGNFIDNRYTIRFFQFDGNGKLHLGQDGEAFLPNDRYELPNKEFRMYYTSLGNKSHAFEVVIENSFGRAKTLEFRVNAKNNDSK